MAKATSGFRWIKGLWDPRFPVSKVPEEKGVMPGQVEPIHPGASTRLPPPPGPPSERPPPARAERGAAEQ